MKRVKNLDVLILCETKLKGKGDEFFRNILGYKSKVWERIKGREVVTTIVKNDCILDRTELIH